MKKSVVEMSQRVNKFIIYKKKTKKKMKNLINVYMYIPGSCINVTRMTSIDQINHNLSSKKEEVFFINKSIRKYKKDHRPFSFF